MEENCIVKHLFVTQARYEQLYFKMLKFKADFTRKLRNSKKIRIYKRL